MKEGFMARYKKNEFAQNLLIPISLQEQIMPGSLEYAISTLVDKRMDMSLFDGKYRNDEMGCRAYDPRILLKVVLLGYSRGLISSRKIEQACRENVVFMALSCGQYPDHSTIASFVSSMKDEILPLFCNVLLICEEMKLLGGTLFALDGCKLPGNASKKWSGSVDDLKKKRKKLEEKVKELVTEQEKQDRDDGDEPPDPDNRSHCQKQIEKLTKQADKIEAWLKENGKRIGIRGKEIKSNITDNESAKMSTSHGTTQGYNSQALVDAKNQVIIHAEAFGNGQDHGHVPPMLDGAKDNMVSIGSGPDYFKNKTLTADSNYHSKENMQKCIDEGVDAYIPDNGFRARDPRFAGRGRYGQKERTHYGLDDFQYNSEDDKYICPQGKELRLNVKRCRATGNVYRRYLGNKEDCSVCKARSQCLHRDGKGPKRLMVPLGPDGVNLTKLMVQKIESERGRKIYTQRIAIIEPVFANIRIQKRLDRFTLRGKIKVNIQWLLYCMVHNIEKIANYGFA
jgi:transposase